MQTPEQQIFVGIKVSSEAPGSKETDPGAGVVRNYLVWQRKPSAAERGTCARRPFLK